MTNELATEVDLTAVRFEPSKIEIVQYEDLKQTVESYADKYRGLVFNEEDIKDAKEVRAEMNKFSKILDDKRKEVKREYNKPLKEFESLIKGLTNTIKEVIDPIDEGIKSVEDQQRQERIDKVKEIAEKKLNKQSDYVKNNFEYSESWFNKTTSQKSIKESIDFVINRLREQEQQKIDSEVIIVNYCKAREVEPEGWLSQLNNGATSAEVMAMIDKSIKDKKEREQAEIERKQHEAKLAKQKEEARLHEEEMQRIREDSYVDLSVESLDQATDLSDFEDDLFTEEPVVEDQTVTLQITGTFDQLNMLNQFFVANGMKVVPIQE